MARVGAGRKKGKYGNFRNLKERQGGSFKCLQIRSRGESGQRLGKFEGDRECCVRITQKEYGEGEGGKSTKKMEASIQTLRRTDRMGSKNGGGGGGGFCGYGKPGTESALGCCPEGKKGAPGLFQTNHPEGAVCWKKKGWLKRGGLGDKMENSPGL